MTFYGKVMMVYAQGNDIIWSRITADYLYVPFTLLFLYHVFQFMIIHVSASLI